MIFKMWATSENYKPIAPTPSNINSSFFHENGEGERIS